MIEKFSYNLHEYDSITKVPQRKNFSKSSEKFIEYIEHKEISEIIHILKVSNIVGDISLGYVREFRSLLLNKTNEYVKLKFTREKLIEWNEFYSQVVLLEELYQTFINNRQEYFEKHPIKYQLSISLLLVCLEEVLSYFTSQELVKTEVVELEKMEQTRDILKGYAAEILKYFLFIDKEKNISHQIFSDNDIEIISKHFNYYDSYESIKDIMEYFRFSKISIEKHDKFRVTILDKEFNSSILISNFREKGGRHSRNLHAISDYNRTIQEYEFDIQEFLSEIELENILGSNWKNLEFDGISINYWNKAYTFIREVCNKKLERKNNIYQLKKVCIVEKKITWINKLKKYLNISKEASEKIIEKLIFRFGSYDLIDTPFVELEDYLVIVPSISEGTSGTYAIISNFSKQVGINKDIEKKGYELERRIAQNLNKANINNISNVKMGDHGENYELDNVFVIDDTIYFVECKTLPYPYTVKEHAEQLCQISSYIKKFERNTEFFMKHHETFDEKFGIRDFSKIKTKKIFITNTMRGSSETLNGVMVIDEPAFSSFLDRKPPMAWNPATGKKVLEKKISYYDGVITNTKLEKFFQKPASIEFMSKKLGNRLTEFQTHLVKSYTVVEDTQLISLEKTNPVIVTKEYNQELSHFR